jgi:hypothetical protein
MHQPLAKKAHAIAGLLFPSLISALGDRLLVLLSGRVDQQNIMVRNYVWTNLNMVLTDKKLLLKEKDAVKTKLCHIVIKLKRTY